MLPAGTVGNVLDCDDADPTVAGPSTWFTDADGDGVGDSDNLVEACEAPVDAVALDGDCDDQDRNTYPGAPELWRRPRQRL